MLAGIAVPKPIQYTSPAVEPVSGKLTGIVIIAPGFVNSMVVVSPEYTISDLFAINPVETTEELIILRDTSLNTEPLYDSAYTSTLFKKISLYATNIILLLVTSILPVAGAVETTAPESSATSSI